MVNHRQLTLAWNLYADDNQNVFADARKWLTGSVDNSPQRYNWDPAVDIMKSPLWPVLQERRFVEMPG